MENEIAWCYQDDVSLCVEGQWEVRMEFNDTVAYLFDASMTVSNRQCSMSDEAPLVEPEMNWTGVIAAILIVCVCLLVAFGAFFLYRSKKVNKMKKGIEVGDEEEEEMDGVEVDTRI